MKKATIPVSIGGIEFDALMGDEWEYTATVPEYATDEGYSVSDSILLEAETLSMELYVSDTPVTWHGRNGHGDNHVDEVVSKLKTLFMKKKTVTVTTTKGTFSSMAIESLKITRSTEDGNSCKISIELKKISKTKVKTVTIPASYGKSGKSNKSSGKANTKKKSTKKSKKKSSKKKSSKKKSSSKKKKSSILYSVGKKIGVIKKKKK